VFVAISLGLSGDAFVPAAKLVFFAHIPIMLIEGLVSAAAVYLIVKVKPGLLRPADQRSDFHMQAAALRAKQAGEAPNG